MIKYIYLLLCILLTACEVSPSSSEEHISLNSNSEVINDDVTTNIEKEEKTEKPAVEKYPEGLWIGKSYYDSLLNGNLTTIFIENYLISYFNEKNEAKLEIGNAYGVQYGIVSSKENKLYYKASYEDDKTEGGLEIIAKGDLQILSTNNYWGYEVEDLVKDSIYIRVGRDTGVNKYNGFYCIEQPLKKLYFSGQYNVLNKKTGQRDIQVLIDEQEIKNFVAGKSLPYQYVPIFPGFNVICLAMEGQFYDINELNRLYYLPSEHQYFIVEDTNAGFHLYELLQPDLDNPKGCIEAHDIESDAVKGDLLYTFTKKQD